MALNIRSAFTSLWKVNERMGRSLKGAKICYFLNGFPKLSETFILNEIWELREKGLDIFLFAVRHSDEEIVQSKDKALMHDVFYLDGLTGRRKLENALITCFCHPFRVVKTALFTRKRFRKSPVWKFKEALYVGGELIRNGVKHIHAHFAMEAAEKAMLASFITGISYSMHPHALDIYVRPRMLRDKMAHAMFVSTPCEFNKRYLLELYPGYPEHKIVVLRLGIDLELFIPSQQQAHKANTPKDLVILSVGRLVEKKGMIYLLRALKALIDDGIMAKVVIIGEGPEYDRLSRFIKENRLDGVVDLKGSCSSEYAKNLFETSDLFVLPCTVAKNGDHDATPTSLLEAMAMKVPVISTSVAGIPEIIPDACGFVIPEKDTFSLAEAIKKVAKMSDSERKAMGEAGRKFVETNCNIHIQADKLVGLFERS